jgi:hypothetical protein
LAWLGSPGLGLEASGLGFTFLKPKPKPSEKAWLGSAWAQAVALYIFSPMYPYRCKKCNYIIVHIVVRVVIIRFTIQQRVPALCLAAALLFCAIIILIT